MILKIILFVLIFIVCYQYVLKFKNEKILNKLSKFLTIKNEKYYDDVLKYYEKNKKIKILSKINILQRISILIYQAGMSNNIFINPIAVMLLCVACFSLSYLIVSKIFNIILLSIIISLPFSLVPIIILKMIASYNKEKLEKVLPNFLLQLKNYTCVNNDIIYAIKQVNTIEPLQSHLNKFIAAVNSGIKFEKAIDDLDEKLKIKELTKLFNNMKSCYVSGGSFSELISKSYYMIINIQKEKLNRAQETKSARLVLWILIALDLLVYFTYVKNNRENYMIMQKSVIGTFILYWNFISMWFLIFLSNKVKKIDE